MKTYKIALMGGDGTGPEVLAEGVKVLQTAGAKHKTKFDFQTFDFGGDRFLRTGETLPDSAVEELRKFDAIYLGAIGHPEVKPGILEVGILLKLRFALDQYINLRPVKLYPNVWTPIKDKGPKEIDFVVVRENTGGIYTGMDEAYILDRSVFDFDLAELARKAGAQLRTSTTVTGVARRPDGWQIEASESSGTKEYHARLLVIADGVESRIARQIGMVRTIPLRDLETCAQYSLTDVEIDQACVHFYTGSSRAPGGYIWVFPKGKGRANVGLGVLASRMGKKKPKALLDTFVEKRFPKAKIVSRTFGGVPVGSSVTPLVANGVLLAGDTARQVNCTNGGGLSYALAAGEFAGRVGAEALRKGDVSSSRLRQYDRFWAKGLGKQQRRSYQLKEALLGIDDNTMDRIAQRMENRQRPLSLAGVFVRVFLRRPVLLWKMRRLLG